MIKALELCIHDKPLFQTCDACGRNIKKDKPTKIVAREMREERRKFYKELEMKDHNFKLYLNKIDKFVFSEK